MIGCNSSQKTWKYRRTVGDTSQDGMISIAIAVMFPGTHGMSRPMLGRFRRMRAVAQVTLRVMPPPMERSF